MAQLFSHSQVINHRSFNGYIAEIVYDKCFIKFRTDISPDVSHARNSDFDDFWRFFSRQIDFRLKCDDHSFSNFLTFTHDEITSHNNEFANVFNAALKPSIISPSHLLGKWKCVGKIPQIAAGSVCNVNNFSRKASRLIIFALLQMLFTHVLKQAALSTAVNDYLWRAFEWLALVLNAKTDVWCSIVSRYVFDRPDICGTMKPEHQKSTPTSWGYSTVQDFVAFPTAQIQSNCWISWRILSCGASLRPV